eukprot:g1940.t1
MDEFYLEEFDRRPTAGEKELLQSMQFDFAIHKDSIGVEGGENGDSTHTNQGGDEIKQQRTTNEINTEDNIADEIENVTSRSDDTKSLSQRKLNSNVVDEVAEEETGSIVDETPPLEDQFVDEMKDELNRVVYDPTQSKGKTSSSDGIDIVRYEYTGSSMKGYSGRPQTASLRPQTASYGRSRPPSAPRHLESASGMKNIVKPNLMITEQVGGYDIVHDDDNDDNLADEIPEEEDRKDYLYGDDDYDEEEWEDLNVVDRTYGDGTGDILTIAPEASYEIDSNPEYSEDEAHDDDHDNMMGEQKTGPKQREVSRTRQQEQVPGISLRTNNNVVSNKNESKNAIIRRRVEFRKAAQERDRKLARATRLRIAKMKHRQKMRLPKQQTKKEQETQIEMQARLLVEQKTEQKNKAARKKAQTRVRRVRRKQRKKPSSLKNSLRNSSKISRNINSSYVTSSTVVPNRPKHQQYFFPSSPVDTLIRERALIWNRDSALHNREKGWSKSMGNNISIPSYDALKDPHCRWIRRPHNSAHAKRNIRRDKVFKSGRLRTAHRVKKIRKLTNLNLQNLKNEMALWTSFTVADEANMDEIPGLYYVASPVRPQSARVVKSTNTSMVQRRNKNLRKTPSPIKKKQRPMSAFTFNSSSMDNHRKINYGTREENESFCDPYSYGYDLDMNTLVESLTATRAAAAASLQMLSNLNIKKV